MKYLPQLRSSEDTKPLKSGSSPYQNIQSSLAALRERGGGAGEGVMPMSYMPPPELAAAEPAAAGVAATLRHTQRMSPARQREKLDKIGSSRGVPPKLVVISP